jgi:hypothetical protein
MKFLRILTLMAVTVALLFLSGIGTFANPGEDNVDAKGGFGQFIDQPMVAINSNSANNRCQDAEVIVGTAVSNVRWEYSEENIIFPSGNNVDDWFAYTTVDDDCPVGTTQVNFGVSITSDDIDLLALTVYDDCGNWPLIMGETPWGHDNELGAVKSNVAAGVTYYIHVNLTDTPEDGWVSYDLTVSEQCNIPPN